MKVVLEGEEKRIKEFLKKESLHFKRNNIKVLESVKETIKEQEVKPKKRGPKPKSE